MAFPITPSRRVRQPHGAVRANPEWRPSALWAFSQPIDVVSQKLITTTAAATYKLQASGMALSVAGNSALDRAILNANQAASDFGNKDFTVLVRFVLRSTRESYVAFGRWFSGGTASQCMWYVGAGNGFNGGTTCDIGVGMPSVSKGASITGITWVLGNEYTIIGRRSGTTIWVDRINHTTGLISAAGSVTDAAITTINSISARNLKIGEFDAGAVYNADIDASVAAILPYKATDAQVRALQDNPWQLFAPPRRLYFDLGRPKGTMRPTVRI